MISFSIIVTHVYLAASDFGIYSDVIYVDAWDWWIVQSFLRLEELSSACLILVVAFRTPFDDTSRLGNSIKRLFSNNKAYDKSKDSATITTVNKVTPAEDRTTTVSNVRVCTISEDEVKRDSLFVT